MAVAKKAVKKTKVAQTVGGKNNKQPLKAVAKKTAVKKPVVVAAPPSPLETARALIAHDVIGRSELRVGDLFEIVDHEEARDLPGSDWSSGWRRQIFLGIDEYGYIVVRDPNAHKAARNKRMPLDAIDFDGVYKVSASTEVKLNSQYTATIKSGVNYVQVGCQNIPVEKVREVLAAYDAAHAPEVLAKRNVTLDTATGKYAELIAK